jgi:hypothetical protein
MESQRKGGVIERWNKAKQFGSIVCADVEPFQRFFLHSDHIQSGTINPVPGMLVYFRVSDKPVPVGKFPFATDAHIDIHEEKVGGVK